MSTSAAREPGTDLATLVGSSGVEKSRAPALRVAQGRVRFPGVPGCATASAQRECVQVSCRYHLAHPDRGGRQLNVTRDCALAVANEGPRTLEEVAQVLGMTRERVRQIEEAAIEKLQRRVALKKIHREME